MRTFHVIRDLRVIILILLSSKPAHASPQTLTPYLSRISFRNNASTLKEQLSEDP